MYAIRSYYADPAHLTGELVEGQAQRLQLVARDLERDLLEGQTVERDTADTPAEQGVLEAAHQWNEA